MIKLEKEFIGEIRVRCDNSYICKNALFLADSQKSKGELE